MTEKENFTIGDLISADFFDFEEKTVHCLFRVTNSFRNELMLHHVYDLDGEPASYVTSLFDDIKKRLTNIRVEEKGPWHDLIIGRQ